MIDSEKPLLRVLAGETAARPPLWLMRQAGRYLPEYRKVRGEAESFLALCYDPARAAEITLQPIRRFALDAAILFSDILVIPDALGQAVAFREGEGPVLEPVRTAQDAARLSHAGQRARLAPVYEAIERVREGLPPAVALIGFAGAPWTIATYMVEGGTSREFLAVKGWAYRAPDEFARLIALLTDSIADHLVAQAEAGAEALQIFESWAGLVPDALFDRLCLEPIAEIARRVGAACPGVPVIVFARGAGAHVARFAALAEVDAVGLDSAASLAWVRQAVQPSAAVQGNLDPVALLEGGAAMRDQATHILERLSAGPFVFNLGHGVLPATPPAHVAELAALIASWPDRDGREGIVAR